MGRIPAAFIDDLLTRVDIVEVVERRVPLKRAGREWTACCPFHDERTPSFYVSPQKQFFHCFGCGAHGSAIRFLMDYEHLEFQDAVEDLASSMGLAVPREGGSTAIHDNHAPLFELLEAAACRYQQALNEHPQARSYCERRGLNTETLQRFRIGWAPLGWDFLYQALGRDATRIRQLEQAGLLATGEQGRHYDRFRERLMFPILDRRGRVIAFGGRILAGDGPKYLNSPETPLFHKGRELFGLWQVRQQAAKVERLIVVEGYMDAIALHQHGLSQAVATLGTATTPEHAELLFRTAADVYYCFDGDRAGRAAAWKALEATLPRLRDGRQAHFLFLPDGEDPDSMIRVEGRAGFIERLEQATPLSRYFFDTLAAGVEIDSLDGRARLAERARPLLAKLPDGAFRDLMVQELEQRTGVRTAPTTAQPTPMRKTGTFQRPTGGRISLIRKAIERLLARPALAREHAPPYRFAGLQQSGVALLVELLQLAHNNPALHTGAVLEHFSGREEAVALHKLAAKIDSDQEDFDYQAELDDALHQLDRQADAARMAALRLRMAEHNLSADEWQELQRLLQAKPEH